MTVGAGGVSVDGCLWRLLTDASSPRDAHDIAVAQQVDRLAHGQRGTVQLQSQLLRRNVSKGKGRD